MLDAVCQEKWIEQKESKQKLDVRCGMSRKIKNHLGIFKAQIG